MGANDKAEATYHGRTPDTDMMRVRYIDGKHYQSKYPNHFFAGAEKAGEEFDRWIELVRAEAKAEALTEAATELNRLDTDVEMYDENLRATQVEWWLRKRAEQIRGGS